MNIFHKGADLYNKCKAGCGMSMPSVLFMTGYVLGIVCMMAGFPGFGAAQDGMIRYEVLFKGLPTDDIRDILRQVSDTAGRQDEPALSLGFLKRRMQQDLPAIEKVFRSKGYYGVRIDTEVDTEERPARAVFRIAPGPVYRLKKVEIDLAGPPDEPLPAPPDVDRPALQPGRPAEAESIIAFRSSITRYFQNRGFPLAKTAEPDVVVDHQDHAVSVTYAVTTGPRAVFGATEITGAETVESSFIREKFPWKPRDPFKADLLDRVRADLLETGLFSVVVFSTGDRVDAQGRLPLTLRVRERKHRTLKLGLGYTTDEDFIARVNWEHRNLLHRGESLSFRSHVSGIRLTLQGAFEKPNVFRPDQSFIFDLRLSDEYPEAYTSRSLTGSAVLKRKLGSGMEAGLGVALTYSEIEQFDQTDTFQLVSLPATFNRDRRDSILDPASGGNLALRAAPFYDFIGGETGFVKGSGLYSHYLRIFSKPRAVLALKGVAGFIGGSPLEDVPADIRFYAGGGGSIRGYAYQSAGNVMGEDNDPVGGRSLLTLSSELRIRITESIGLVPFLDGGNVFESAYPDFDRSLLWGAGLGLRYITAVGPLRLDLAFPINERSFDDPFQLYISIGQAF
ncbi:MAG: autotransporter assembly complex family protein [Desulfobacterales bacterium]